MLLLDTAAEAAGLSVYADHADGAMYHYLPGAPRIVSQPGSPGVQLLRYRGDRKGAFLSLDVDLTVPESLLASARGELSRRTGREVRLVPVLFREGTVRLTALAVESAPAAAATEGATSGTATASSFLVEHILAVATPSLMGHGRAVFSVELSPEGSTLVAGALGAEALPVIVAYDLTFDGLRPARGLRARVQYRMSYEFLRARVRPDVLFFKADVDRESESLRREGHITIEDVDYTGSDPVLLAQRAAEARATVNELAEALFFRPAASPATVAATLPADAPVAAAWAHGGRAQAAFTLRALNQEESGTLEYDYREARVGRWRVAPQGALRLPDGIEPAAVVRDITLTEVPVAVPLRVFSLPDADWTGVATIEVELRSTDGTVSTCAINPAAPEQRVVVPAGASMEWRARVLAVDDPGALGSAPRDFSPFQPLSGRVLQIDPATLAGRRIVTLAVGRIDPRSGLRVSGRLRSDDARREFLLDAQHPEVKIPIWKGARVRVEWTFETAAASAAERSRDLAAGETAVIFNAPGDLYQTIVVMLQDPLERIQSTTIEIEAPGGAQRRSMTLDAASPRAEWTMLRTGPNQPYRYRLSTIGRDGAIVESAWREHAGSLLVVGDTHVRVQPIEVIVTGVTDSLGVLVKLTSLAPPEGVNGTVERLLDPGVVHFHVGLPLRPGEPTRYRIEGQVFLETGERAFGPVEESSEVLIINASA